jgi:hypothetical protein
MADLPDIFIANYHDDPDVPNCDTGTNLEAVVLNIPNPGRYGRVLQNPTDPSFKPANYCPQIPAASLIPTFDPDPVVAEHNAAGETNIPTDGPVFTPTCTGHPPPKPTFTGIITTVTENVTLTPISTGTIGPDVNEAAVTCTKSRSSETTMELEFTGRPRNFYRNDGHDDHSSMTVTPIIVVSSLPFGEDPSATTTGSPGITPPPASTSAPVLFTLTTFPLGHPPVSHGPRDVAYKCNYNGQIICYSETVYGECTWGVAAAGPVPKGFKCKDGKLKPLRDDDRQPKVHPDGNQPRNPAYGCVYDGQIICYSETVYGECSQGAAPAISVPEGWSCKDGRLKPQDDDNVRRADVDFEGNDRTVHDMPAEDDPNNKDKKKPKPPVPSPSPRNPFNGNEKRAEGDPNNKDKKKPKPPVPSPSPRNPRDISLGRNRFLPNGTTSTTAAWAHPVPTGYPYNPPRGDAVPCIFQGELICFNSTAIGHCNNGWAVPHILPEDSLCFRGRIIPKPKDQVHGFEPKNPGPGFTTKAKRQSCWTCTQPTMVAVADPQPTDQEDGFKLENAGPSFITKVKRQNCTMPTIAAVADPKPTDQEDGLKFGNAGPEVVTKVKRQTCWTCTLPTIVAAADPEPMQQEFDNAGPKFVTKVKRQNCTMPTIAAVAEPQDQVA